MKKIALALTFFLSAVCQGFADDATGELFPFVISYDNPQNVTSVASFIEAPAGQHGFIRSDANGNFCHDAGIIRFEATNITGPANFPSHENADKIAERLARLGFNCVRLHFMDTWYTNFMTKPTQGILADASQTQRNLDPKQLDKLDYMIAAFKKRGIYVNMNLHVGRTLDERDGVVRTPTWANKSFDQFVPRLIELQKEYAKQLLTHVNPYTGNPYTHEPAVAMIEINNENSFQQGWFSGLFDAMPEVYKQELNDQWNAWLRKRYATNEELATAWNCVTIEEPLGEELIPCGQFNEDSALKTGGLSVFNGGGKATAKIENGALKLSVAHDDGYFCPKLYQDIQLKKGQLYTFSVTCRVVDGPSLFELSVAAVDLRQGFRILGMQKIVKIKKGSEVTLVATFRVQEDCNDAKIQLTRFRRGEYEIKNLSLRTGGKIVNPLEGVCFPKDAVATPQSWDRSNSAMLRDFGQFMEDTETAYWLAIYRCVKEELGAQSLVSGTQVGYSAEHVQAKLDYVDTHAYWHHPQGNQTVVGGEWRLFNVSMVNSMGCLVSLARNRVAGKAFTVSEYNHPYPNQFGAEGQLMMAVVGRLQGWGGIFQYSYNHFVDSWEPPCSPTNCIFDSIARTDCVAHYPACSAIFVRGDVAEAKEILTIAEDLETYRQSRMDSFYIAYGMRGLPIDFAMLHKIQLDVDGKQNGLKREEFPKLTPSKVLVSDTGEIVWNREIPGKSFLAVRSPNTKLFTGFPEGRAIDLNGLKLSVGPTQLNWATISLTSKNEKGFGGEGKSQILLTATGNCEVAGRELIQLGDNWVTIRNYGGGSMMCEGIPATLTFPASVRVRCWALTDRGDRKEEVPVETTADGTVLKIGPKYRTVWYEIEAE